MNKEVSGLKRLIRLNEFVNAINLPENNETDLSMNNPLEIEVNLPLNVENNDVKVIPFDADL